MSDPLNLDVTDVTHYDRTDQELEAFLLLAIVVAGKTAHIQERKLRAFLAPCGVRQCSPFELIRWAEERGLLEQHIRLQGLGQYRRLVPCFREIVSLNPRTCTREELEAVMGIGPKTSRFFLLHSRPKQLFAVLDTHILAWLRENGYPDAPRVTPGSRGTYDRWEKVFLKEAQLRDINPADLDMKIWLERSKKPKEDVRIPNQADGLGPAQGQARKPQGRSRG